MNSLKRIERKIGYKIPQELKVEITSLYGENFSNDKDQDIVKLINEYYTLQADTDFEFTQIAKLKLFICLIILNVASYFVVGAIYSLVFYNTEFTLNLFFSTMLRFSYTLVLVIIIAMAIFYYFFRQYEQHYENSINLLKYKKTLKLIITFIIILSIVVIIFNLIVSPSVAWGFVIIVGILNSIWGELLGNYHYLSNK